MTTRMIACNSDFHYLYVDVAGHGLLPVEAERQGKVVVTTELGGGGLVTRDTHALAERGLANVLRHAGVLAGEVETRASLGLPEAVILDGRDLRNYVFAPTSGILETLVDVGETITAGQVLGRLYSLEHRSAARGDRGAARRRGRRDPGDLVDGAGRQRLRARPTDRGGRPPVKPSRDPRTSRTRQNDDRSAKVAKLAQFRCRHATVSLIPSKTGGGWSTPHRGGAARRSATKGGAVGRGGKGHAA
jgi:hypothetical protein